jgi:hypothetical protein
MAGSGQPSKDKRSSPVPTTPQPWLDAEGLRLLRRAIFVAAGGEHDNWEEYDRVMTEQRRAVVLIRPNRIYSN